MEARLCQHLRARLSVARRLRDSRLRARETTGYERFALHAPILSTFPKMRRKGRGAVFEALRARKGSNRTCLSSHCQGRNRRIRDAAVETTRDPASSLILFERRPATARSEFSPSETGVSTSGWTDPGIQNHYRGTSPIGNRTPPRTALGP